MEADSDVSARLHLRGPGRFERVKLAGFAGFLIVGSAAVLIPSAQALEDPLDVARPTRRWCASGAGQ